MTYLELIELIDAKDRRGWEKLYLQYGQKFKSFICMTIAGVTVLKILQMVLKIVGIKISFRNSLLHSSDTEIIVAYTIFKDIPDKRKIFYLSQ